MLPAQLTFTVEPPDSERLKGHVRRLYNFFWTRHQIDVEVTTSDLIRVAKAQYNTRLRTLRLTLIPMGWCIDDIGRVPNGEHLYRLVPLVDSTFYEARKEKFKGKKNG